MEKSNLDVAFEIMQNREEAITFQELWKKVYEIQDYPLDQRNSRMAKFYTNLFMDGRFITLGDNTWDLRDRYSYSKVHIDMNDVYHEDEEQTDYNDLEEDNENEEIENEEIEEDEEY